MSVVVITHLICAAAFAILTVSLLAGRQRGRTRNLLAMAALATAAWAVAGASPNVVPFTVVAVVESIRNAAWLVFVSSLLTEGAGRVVVPWARTGTIIAVSVAAVSIVVDLAVLALAPGADRLFQPQLLARVGATVIGLSLIENYYRNIEADRRWNVVPLTIALGAMFAFDLFYYVDVFLTEVDRSLTAARLLADALTVPLLALATMRNAQWRTDIRMSHNAAFHALTLVSSGVFLLSAAVVGMLFRRFGGDWGMVLQVTTMFGSAVVLATVLSSETARSGIRLALLRNFFSYRYDYRVEWLRCIEALSAGDTAVDLPERVIRAIADSVNCPGGVLFQRNDHLLVASAFWNARVPDLAQEPVDSSFIAGFRGGRWIQELRAERGAGPESVPLPTWLDEADDFWLAVPLPHRGELVGFVLLARPRAPVKPDWEVFDLLRTLARQAASYLSERQAQRALADANMLQEYSTRFAFVVHDIKNLSSQLGLILSNARRHAGNPEFQADVMLTVENSVERMNKLLSQLKMAVNSAPRRPPPVEIEAGAGVDALALARELASSQANGARIDLVCGRSSVAVAMEAEGLRSVLSHLVNNAVEASGSHGRVTVNLGAEGDRAIIEISDQGPGMDANFVRDELFRPFRSTKDGGFGIGAFQTRELVRAAGGQLEVTSKPGAGTTMRIVLKRAADAAAQISPAA